MTDHKVYKKVIVVNSSHGDWSGIYLDSELWAEHHSLHTQDWAELINGHHIDSVEVKEVCGEWLEMCGNLPQKFEDIPLEMIV